jgi:hypothetical protein
MMTRIARKTLMSPLTLCLILAAALCPTGRALALDRAGYSMEILIDGTPLREYAARDTRYIEAFKGREYSVRLRNGTGERVAIALSVDGLNSIDARTTSALEARKWVLEPYETIALSGWQTTSTTSRKFFFTTEDRSYGDWLGRTKNLGLIAAAVFREKRPPVVYESGPSRENLEDQLKALGYLGSPKKSEPESSARPARPDDLAATGIGQETSHPVRQVSFDPEDSPTAVLQVRYEYRDSLVRLGVLPADGLCEDSLSRREAARGFVEPGYAPDPYRRRNR